MLPIFSFKTDNSKSELAGFQFLLLGLASSGFILRLFVTLFNGVEEDFLTAFFRVGFGFSCATATLEKYFVSATVIRIRQVIFLSPPLRRGGSFEDRTPEISGI